MFTYCIFLYTEWLTCCYDTWLGCDIKSLILGLPNSKQTKLRGPNLIYLCEQLTGLVMSVKKLSICLPKCYEQLKPCIARNLHHFYFYTVFSTKTVPGPEGWLQHCQFPQEEKERSGSNIRDKRSLRSEQDLSRTLFRFSKAKMVVVPKIYKYNYVFACLNKYIYTHSHSHRSYIYRQLLQKYIDT